MNVSELRVGTRASVLARTQTRAFCEDLVRRHPHLTLSEVLISTEGDGSTEPLSASKNPGVFVSALRDALVEHRVDIIVHSMKDLPAKPHPAITTGCVPAREDARDGFVSRGNVTLAELPSGAVVGTSSPRRAASLRRRRADLTVVNIRGNIDTRIEKVMRGDVDATLLAMAGLNRIGRADMAVEVLDSHDFVPAPGQGALTVECRADDQATLELLRALNDRGVRLVTTAERAVLRGLDAGCSTAIGAHATYGDGTLTLTAELAVEETGEANRVRLTAELQPDDRAAAEALGREAARQLLDSPIAARVAETFNRPPLTVTDESRGIPGGLSAVLLIRANRNDVDAAALERLGIPVAIDPYLSITPSGNGGGARRLLASLEEPQPTWLIATSTNALAFFEGLLKPGELERVIRKNPNLRFAAIGKQSKTELEQRGATGVVTPDDAYAESLADVLVRTEPRRAVIPSGSIAMDTLTEALGRNGFDVRSEVVYNTEMVTKAPRSCAAVQRGEISAVVFRSPSAVRAFHRFNGAANITVFCTGRTTARQAQQLGFTVAGVADNPSPDSVAVMVAHYLKAQA